MSYCSHDPYCPGYGPEHEAQAPGGWPIVPTVTTAPPPEEQPTLEDLMEARIQMRRQVKSGNPARKTEALRNLLALEGLIRREQIRLSQSEVVR